MAEHRATVTAEEKKSDPSKSAKQPLVVIDLGKRQSPQQIKRLRKGRGRLMERIDDIVDELVQNGTVKADAQPVVIVVRERSPAMPFSMAAFPFPVSQNDEEDDDDDDEDDKDDKD